MNTVSSIVDSIYASLSIVALAAVLALPLASCGEGDDSASDRDGPAVASNAEQAGAPASESVERAKPAPGTGNVQGKVLYNGKPAVGIEVILCEEFNRFGSGCGGKTFTATTDSAGEYVITNIEPREYAALLAKVFDTESYVFATTGLAGLSSESYKVEADKTMFADPTNLFKSDLRVSSPKAGSKVTAESAMALQWDQYPDAAYYKFSLFPDSATVISPYISHRVDSNAFSVEKRLERGEYRIEVEAFNASDIKLAESSDDITFTVN